MFLAICIKSFFGAGAVQVNRAGINRYFNRSKRLEDSELA